MNERTWEGREKRREVKEEGKSERVYEKRRGEKRREEG